jgi:hypothetical protein
MLFRTTELLSCLQRKASIKELENERRDKRPVCGKYVNGKGEEAREDSWINQ